MGNPTRCFKQGRVLADNPQEAMEKAGEIGQVVNLKLTWVKNWYEYIVEVEHG